LLDSERNVYSCGSNTFGQLGIGNNFNKNIPVKIPSKIKYSQISCGYSHSLLLDSEGNVYSCGYNKNGELGIGNNEDQNIPVKIQFEKKFTQISCGFRHSLLLDSEGNVYSCGRNEYGQLGIGNDNGFGQLGIGNNENQKIPVKIPSKKNFTQISSGGYHSLLLDSEGNVYSCGRNEYGQLGIGDVSFFYRFQVFSIPKSNIFIKLKLKRITLLFNNIHHLNHQSLILQQNSSQKSS